jgi:hypothetical protein
MSNYTKATDFAAKDSLPSGNAAKVVKGTEIDDEFAAIQTAIATKAELAGSAAQNFSANNLTVAGNVAVTGGLTVGDGTYIKTWVSFSATGGTVTILDSYNVDSVVRSSTGIFTITYTNALPAATYGVLLGGSAEAMRGPTGSYNVNDIDVSTENDAGTEIDPALVTVAIIY